MEIVRDRLECARRRAWIAPAIAGAVVPASASKSRGLSLHPHPRISGGVACSFKDHRRATFPRAIDIERAAPDVYRSADLRIALPIPPFADLLVNDTDQSQRNHHQNRSLHLAALRSRDRIRTKRLIQSEAVPTIST